MIAALAILGFAVALGTMLLRRREGREQRVAVVVVLVAALAGYAATGRPALPSASPQPLALDRATTLFQAERQARFARFGPSAAWLTFTDALLRADASAMAIRALRGEIDVRPDDAELWIGLGHALAVHAGQVGDASRLAFDRAATLAPRSPHPAFFLGLTQYEAGDRAGAAATWRRLRTRALPTPDLDTWIARADGD